MSYAEALKKVEEDGSRGRYPERSGVSSRSVPVQRDRPTTDIYLFVFLAMVIISTARMERKSRKIEFVVAGPERYLGVQDLTSEEVQGVLSGGVPFFQVLGLRSD